MSFNSSPPNLGCIMYFSLIYLWQQSLQGRRGPGQRLSSPTCLAVRNWRSLQARASPWGCALLGCASQPERCQAPGASQAGRAAGPPEEKQRGRCVPAGCWLKWRLGAQQRAGCCIAAFCAQGSVTGVRQRCKPAGLHKHNT